MRTLFTRLINNENLQENIMEYNAHGYLGCSYQSLLSVKKPTGPLDGNVPTQLDYWTCQTVESQNSQSLPKQVNMLSFVNALWITYIVGSLWVQGKTVILRHATVQGHNQFFRTYQPLFKFGSLLIKLKGWI